MVFRGVDWPGVNAACETTMKQPIRLLSMVSVALVCCAVTGPHCAAAEETAPVLAQDLQNLRVPGKVGAVLWTRRPDRYTLQVVFPRTTRMLRMVDGRRVLNQTAPPPADAAQLVMTEAMTQELRALGLGENPTVQAWLLKADGTHITIGRRALFDSGKLVNYTPDEVLYSTSLEAGQGAVAVALMVDGAFFIEPLKPFVSGRP
jgi:hypothetical protein